MGIKWGSFAKFLLKWAPGIVEAIFQMKAKQDAQKPAKPPDTSNI